MSMSLFRMSVSLLKKKASEPELQHVIYHDQDHPPTGLQPGDMQMAPGPSVAQPPPADPNKPRPPTGDKIIVVGKLKEEDSSWVTNELPDWQQAIYIVDDPTAPLHTLHNKGHEGNAYLTYIIEHYDSLPSTIVFTHSHRQSWHVDAPDNLNPLSIASLQIPYVQTHGYANLRCSWEPGCPDEIQPYRDWSLPNATQGKEIEYPEVEQQFRSVWWGLFNNTNVPETVAVGCCAQFAVSREQVLKRPREEYEWYLRYMNESVIEDQILGRVFEYLWHIIFGREAVHCPGPFTCYKEVFGRDVAPGMEVPEVFTPTGSDAPSDVSSAELDAVENGEAGMVEAKEDGTELIKELEGVTPEVTESVSAEEASASITEEQEGGADAFANVSEDAALPVSDDAETIVSEPTEDPGDDNTFGRTLK
ncbi:hypothetical protein BDZ85DRAFT_316449 [Elsinoe ampelina]|uniref:Uncharacterized protein n=1 Tax=Elsinoe ampelina TaxID=302913 RepID=A0A6A6GMQ0_9PEZI|nr:hypothetical protein BDZ85DRAFT_316449 [Elsinoe ampelina]